MRRCYSDDMNHSIHRSLSISEDALHTTINGVGLVVPYDFALDAEFWRWMPEDISLYITRTPKLESTTVTVDQAKQVSDHTAAATAIQSLLAAWPASIGYACTSGSFVEGREGERALQNAMIAAGAPKAVTTSGALLEALEHLDIKKIAIATPYNESLTRLLGDYLYEAGCEVVSSAYLNCDEAIARVSYTDVRRLAQEIDHPEAEAIFFSCTNLRTFDIIEELEIQLGKPVLSANQVTIWSMLRLAGFQPPSLKQQLFQ